MSSPPVWLITGAGSGFGYSLALIALRAGHKVIATSRNPSKTPERISKVEKLGGVWHTLDVTSSEPLLAEAVQKATSVWGRIDILVNAAGYAVLGAFECINDTEARSQMETNFFGPLTLTRLVVPQMRSRRSGTIVQISSGAGIISLASRSLYSASKYALEGFSETLHREMKPFGVKVLIVEPGAFNTGFAGTCRFPEMTKELQKEYEDTDVGKMLSWNRSLGKEVKMPGDVEKGCRAIFDRVMGIGIAEGMEETIRLPLGKDTVGRWREKIEEHQKTLEVTERLWSATDVDE